MVLRNQKILLLGKDGQLGWELQRCLAPLGDILAFGRQQADLSKPTQVVDLIHQHHPQIIINAAAYTAVDQAETDIEQCMTINRTAPALVAEAANEIRAIFIHYATDYVFDGRQNTPYKEDDAVNPLNVYGQSKLDGEKAILKTDSACLILRTSWVYSLRRPSFVSKIIEWAKTKPSLRVINDQVGSPTWSRMLAETTSLLLAAAPVDALQWIKERRGIYHLAGDGYTSRYELAKFIMTHAPHPERLICQNIFPAATADFPSPAQRPAFSALNCEKFKTTFNLTLPPWQNSLILALEEIA